jgi:hypothetical protein
MSVVERPDRHPAAILMSDLEASSPLARHLSTASARIEACATGGRTLASKSLIERLNRTDADALGLDTVHTTYTPLADLSTATDKARRDAPSIAVCEV